MDTEMDYADYNAEGEDDLDELTMEDEDEQLTQTEQIHDVPLTKTRSKRMEATTGRWTVEEHEMFVKGIEMHGKEWKKISQMIPTRTVVQIRTHAQKYFIKLSRNEPSGHSSISTSTATPRSASTSNKLKFSTSAVATMSTGTGRLPKLSVSSSPSSDTESLSYNSSSSSSHSERIGMRTRPQRSRMSFAKIPSEDDISSSSIAEEEQHEPATKRFRKPSSFVSSGLNLAISIPKHRASTHTPPAQMMKSRMSNCKSMINGILLPTVYDNDFGNDLADSSPCGISDLFYLFPNESPQIASIPPLPKMECNELATMSLDELDQIVSNPNRKRERLDSIVDGSNVGNSANDDALFASLAAADGEFDVNEMYQNSNRVPQSPPRRHQSKFHGMYSPISMNQQQSAATSIITDDEISGILAEWNGDDAEDVAAN